MHIAGLNREREMHFQKKFIVGLLAGSTQQYPQERTHSNRNHEYRAPYPIPLPCVNGRQHSLLPRAVTHFWHGFLTEAYEVG